MGPSFMPQAHAIVPSSDDSFAPFLFYVMLCYQNSYTNSDHNSPYEKEHVEGCESMVMGNIDSNSMNIDVDIMDGN